MELKARTLKEFKNIMEKDYGVLLSDENADEFGSSLLRLTKLALEATAKAEENKINNKKASTT